MKISKSFAAFYVQYKLDKLKEKIFNFAGEAVKNVLLDFGIEKKGSIVSVKQY